MPATSPLVRVCVTGPESTGKTTLAQQLAEALGTEWVPEAARMYAERVARPLTPSDIEPIAREHMALADAAAQRVRAQGGTVLVTDTDLISTIVYARHYYGEASDWLEREKRARKADLYLLCDVDVAWVPDGIRDRPSFRELMFREFLDALSIPGARVQIVRGSWDARWALALAAVQDRLKPVDA